MNTNAIILPLSSSKQLKRHKIAEQKQNNKEKSRIIETPVNLVMNVLTSREHSAKNSEDRGSRPQRIGDEIESKQAVNRKVRRIKKNIVSYVCKEI